MAESSARWQERLRALLALVGAGGPGYGEAQRAELCVLLHAGLRRYLGLHSSRMGRVDPVELEDLVSEKALDLFARAESREWRIEARSAGELAAYLSNVARNALLRFYERRGRVKHLEEPEMFGSEEATAQSSVESEQFVDKLLQCVERLKERDRLVWFLRVFHEMSSKEIARHREVALKPGHVDVLLQRARESVQKCLGHIGLSASDLPTGCFATLWERLRSGRLPWTEPSHG